MNVWFHSLQGGYIIIHHGYSSERKQLCGHRDDDMCSCEEGIGGDDAKGWWAVDKDIVVGGFDWLKDIVEDLFSCDDIGECYFCS